MPLTISADQAFAEAVDCPAMCRWNAYVGQPLVMGELLYRTRHSLIDESLHARMGAETTNGDGFGVGWYLARDRSAPARYRSVSPAWNDINLRELADHIQTPLFLAHIRAAVGSPVQQTNCHPFRHGRWLFVHNGFLDGFHQVRRELLLAVDEQLFDGIAGSTDSELLFHLALTFGLADDPLGAMERAVGFVESTARRSGIDQPVQMTVGISDGQRFYAVRYSSQHDSRTLFYSEDVNALRRLHPENERLQQLSEGDRVVVSEPLADLPGAWIEVPESTALLLADGEVETRPFEPRV
jgi:predicted glutamine amidotransferase